MNNKTINQKIEAALSSLDDIQRAEADDALFDSILHQLNEKKIKVSAIVPMRTVWLAAASFALVVSLDVVLLLQNQRHTEGGHSNAARAISQIYFSPNP